MFHFFLGLCGFVSKVSFGAFWCQALTCNAGLVRVDTTERLRLCGIRPVFLSATGWGDVLFERTFFCRHTVQRKNRGCFVGKQSCLRRKHHDTLNSVLLSPMVVCHFSPNVAQHSETQGGGLMPG